MLKLKIIMKVGILGDSLASLTLAKTLVNDGIFVDLIHNKNVRTINKNRTIGITKTNIEFFDKKILNISKKSFEVNKIEISLEKFNNKSIFNFDNNKKKLFSIIKNYKLYELLNDSLIKSKLFSRKNFFLNKFKIDNNYQIIINCDPNNPLTKKIFHKKIKKNYESIAYTTIINHKRILENKIAYQIFTKYGPIAYLPISEYETSIVYSVKKKDNLKEPEIFDLINKYNPKYQIKNIKKIESFELFFSNLRTYYHKNILAFGDLLHRVHPLAGQGFNMTIRDIRILNQIINNRISLGLELDSSVCIEFEKKLRHKNFLFSSGIDFIYEFFNLENKLQSDKFRKVMQIFDKNKSLTKLFTKLADDGI